MIYCFDIDGTICTNTEGDYENAKPFLDVVAEVNRLYYTGNRILLNTARGGTTGTDWTDVTKGQLKKWGVHYHELIMAKPTADVFIDDRAINAVAWRSGNFKQNLDATKKLWVGNEG
jgi:uncharacterized HAD superfamily protein